MLEKMFKMDFCDRCDAVKNCKGMVKNSKCETVSINSSMMCSKSTSRFLSFQSHRSFVLLQIFLYLTLIHLSNGFNVDSASRIEIDGPNPGSYFGFTVGMLRQNDQSRWWVLNLIKYHSQDRKYSAYPAIFRALRRLNVFLTMSNLTIICDYPLPPA